MKLYTYIVASDTGFAPHPFDNYLSLACCKPVIRRTARIKDWIIGLGSVNNVGNEKIIYAMEVTEKFILMIIIKIKDSKTELITFIIYLKENGSKKRTIFTMKTTLNTIQILNLF